MSWLDGCIWLMQLCFLCWLPLAAAVPVLKVHCKYWQQEASCDLVRMRKKEREVVGLVGWWWESEMGRARGPAFSQGSWVCLDAVWQGTHCLPREQEGAAPHTAFIKCQNAHEHMLAWGHAHNMYVKRLFLCLKLSFTLSLFHISCR